MSAVRRAVFRKLLEHSQSARGLSATVHQNNPTTPIDTWSATVKDAERVIGYSTSFLNLRWILNDEIANIAGHIRKLIGTNHPLLKTAKSLLVRNDMPSWGLLVLLVSKAAGLNSSFSELECDRTADILHSQRILSEVTEMIKTSHLIHKGLLKVTPEDNNYEDLKFGNNLALLSGDYLLSLSFGEIAKIGNFKVQENMSSTLRDLSESEFIGLRDNDNNPLPSEPLPVQDDIQIPLGLGVKPFKFKHILGHMKAEWTLRNVLSGASLLAKSCQCCMILANHGTDVQEMAYTLGRNLALAWQARLETDCFLKGTFSLVGAPIMLHLEHDPLFYEEIQKGSKSVDLVDRDLIMKTVMAGPALQRTREVQNEFLENAKDVLDKFSDSDAKKVLVKIVNSM